MSLDDTINAVRCKLSKMVTSGRRKKAVEILQRFDAQRLLDVRIRDLPAVEIALNDILAPDPLTALRACAERLADILGCDDETVLLAHAAIAKMEGRS